MLVLTLAGCASDKPLNPSFPLTRKFAHEAIREMVSDPTPLPRPVIVLGGIHDPGIIAAHIADVIRDTTPERAQVIDIAFFEGGTFESCADKVIRKVDAALQCDDSTQTAEVDVVGYSMGGLVARYAASDEYAAKRGRRLHIARLFTISTPHQGAALAGLPTLDARVKDMRAGSAFLEHLNGAGSHGDAGASSQPQPNDLQESPYPILAYARLHDAVIGERHAAPLGVTAWWVANGPFTLSHLLAGYDERILADILRRLRGQEPFTSEPAAPLPDS